MTPTSFPRVGASNEASTDQHRGRDATVHITPEYLAQHTVLAYATTIAGAQGRNVDTGHVVVAPRTIAASLYVGMTRGRQRNHAHVVTDGHDHDELQLGHRSGLKAFADAIMRNPDGDTSATTVQKRWAAGEGDRIASRRHDMAREQAARWWAKASDALPTPVRAATVEHADAVIAALVGLPPASWRTAVHGTVRTTDWRSPNAAASFVDRLRRATPSQRLSPPSITRHSARGYAR